MKTSAADKWMCNGIVNGQANAWNPLYMIKPKSHTHCYVPTAYVLSAFRPSVSVKSTYENVVANVRASQNRYLIDMN